MSLKFIHAFLDFKIAVYSWRIWQSLALQDILQRYRGSILGPFWITISTAITVYSMGYLYGSLFKIDRGNYLPFFATGMITWNFISMIVAESTKIFMESKSYLENIKLPTTVYIFRLVYRNIIILFHNILVYISLPIFFKIDVNIYSFLFLPGLFILSINGIFFGAIIAYVSAKFPDVGSIITNILQLFFFITPIMWDPKSLPEKYHFFLSLNPFVYFIDLLRSPLLGLPYTQKEMVGVALLTLIGMVSCFLVIKTYRTRLIFWV